MVRRSNPDMGKKFFFTLKRPYRTLRPTQPVQLAPGFIPGRKKTQALSSPLICIQRWEYEWVELYLCSPFIIIYPDLRNFKS